MTGKVFMVTVLSLVMVAAGYGLVQAHGSESGNGNDRGYGQGMMGSGQGMMGGMMGQQGGMMGQGRGSNYPMQTPLTEEDARVLIEYHIRFIDQNPNLKVRNVKKTEDGFEVEVVTRKGEGLVDRYLVESDTGRVYRILE